jgi:hypothetical protein
VVWKSQTQLNLKLLRLATRDSHGLDVRYSANCTFRMENHTPDDQGWPTEVDHGRDQLNWVLGRTLDLPGSRRWIKSTNGEVILWLPLQFILESGTNADPPSLPRVPDYGDQRQELQHVQSEFSARVRDVI